MQDARVFGLRHGLVAALSLFLLCGCSRKEAPMSEAEAAAPAPELAAGATGAVPDTSPATPSRMVVRTAALTVRSEDPDRESEQAARYVTEHGGYVGSKDAARTEGDAYRVHLVLRVPADVFESTLSELRRSRTVLTESVTGEDVTEQYSDMQARLRAKRQLEERLLGVLATAKQVKDLLEVERELSRVRTEIEQLEGRSRLMAHSAALATIAVDFVSPTVPSTPGSESLASRFRNAFGTASDLFVSTTTSLVVVAGAASPVVLLALGMVVAWRVRRRVRG